MVRLYNPSFIYTRYPFDFDDPTPGDTHGLPTVIDLKTPVKAEVVNRQKDSILAIESELGIKPSGTYGTVRARLDALESRDGYNDGYAYIDIRNNGVSIVNPVSVINFIGSGVSVAKVGTDEAEITITGGGSDGYSSDGYCPIHEALIVSSPGQTTFTLLTKPWLNSLALFIDGIKQEIGDYSISSKTLTWLGTQTLRTTDIVEVYYSKVIFIAGVNGGESLSETLSIGNITDGTDIVITENDKIYSTGSFTIEINESTYYGAIKTLNINNNTFGSINMFVGRDGGSSLSLDGYGIATLSSDDVCTLSSKNKTVVKVENDDNVIQICSTSFNPGSAIELWVGNEEEYHNRFIRINETSMCSVLDPNNTYPGNPGIDLGANQDGYRWGSLYAADGYFTNNLTVNNLINSNGIVLSDGCSIIGTTSLLSSGGSIYLLGGDGYDIGGELTIGGGNSSNSIGGNTVITSGNGYEYPGDIALFAGTSSIGYGGNIHLICGDSGSGENLGGRLQIEAGDGYYGGSVNIYAGEGSLYGGDVLILPGAATDGLDGRILFLDSEFNLVVKIDKDCDIAPLEVYYDSYFANNVTIGGKLTVDGLIDPTGLVLVGQNSVPGGNPVDGSSTLWFRNSDGYLISTDKNGNDIVINGIVPGAGDANKIVQASSTGNGIDYSIIESSLSSSIENDGQRHFKRNDTVVITDYPYSASDHYISTTGSINNGSSTLIVADGSELLNNYGIVIQGAGSAHGLKTPNAPEVFQQGTTGASTVEVKVVAATRHRGYTVASSATTIVNAAAAFTKTNWLGVWPEIIPGATWYLIYVRRGGVGSFTLRKVIPGQITLSYSNATGSHRPVVVIDSETAISTLPMFPLTEPVSSQSNYLRTRIISGGGTTNLIINTPARTTVSSLNVYNDNWSAITDALDSFPKMPNSPIYLGGDIEIPRGEFLIWDDIHVMKTSSIRGHGGNWNIPISQIRPIDSLYGLSIDHNRDCPQWTPGVPVKLRDSLRPARYWNNLTYIWECTTPGITGTTYPTFTYTVGTTITDGSVVWTCANYKTITAAQSILEHFGLIAYNKLYIDGVKAPLIPGAFEVAGTEIVANSVHNTYVTVKLWTPGGALVSGRYVVPSDGYETGFRYRIGSSGTSGLTEPIWSKIHNSITLDNGISLTAEWMPVIWGAGILTSAQMSANHVCVTFSSGWAWFLNGKSSGTGTNTDGAIFDNISAYECGGGIYIEGYDASIATFNNAFVGVCGAGLVDLGFYGSRFMNCFWESNYRGPQNSLTGVQSCSRFDGCYWEDVASAAPDHYLYSPSHGSGGVIGAGTLIKGTMKWSPLPSSNGFNYGMVNYNPTCTHPLTSVMSWPGTDYCAFETYTQSDGASQLRGHLRFLFNYTTRIWSMGSRQYSQYKIAYQIEQGSAQGDMFQVDKFHLGVGKSLLSVVSGVPTTGCYQAGDLLLWSNPSRLAIKNKTTGGYCVPLNDGYWTNNQAYGAASSNVIRNTINTHIFAIITGGTSGSVEPTWNTTLGTITTDGSCEWICWSTYAVPEWISQPAPSADIYNLPDSDAGIGYATRRARTTTTYTNHHSITLSAIDAIKGDLIEILRDDSGVSYHAYIKRADTTLIYTLDSKGSVELLFDGTNWIVLRGSSWL